MEAEKQASKLDIKRHELSMCRDKASESTYTQTVAEMGEKEAQLATLEKEAGTLKVRHVTCDVPRCVICDMPYTK